MKIRSKRYRAALAVIGKPEAAKTPRPIPDAVALIKKMTAPKLGAKFTESVDLSVHLNLDTKKADQQFRGSFSFPHGTGRAVRVIVFCDDGDKIQASMAAGAVKAGGEDVVNAVNDGFMDFDVAIATPKMMRFVGKLGKVLGPRGLMPSPKSGTVTDDVVSAVKEFKAGKTEYRTDANGNVHTRVGTTRFEEAQLSDNVLAFLNHVAEHRPSSVKGEFVNSVTISTTMGPGLRIAFSTSAEA
jgi:large subunit ribosomal protein L1